MTDAPPPPISTERGSVVGTAGKWLSLFGVLIATGQAGTAWLHGYWQAEGEKQKAAQELALAELKGCDSKRCRVGSVCIDLAGGGG